MIVSDWLIQTTMYTRASNHLSSHSTRQYRWRWVMLRHIVMSWRHNVTLWHNHICKYRINDIFELVNPKYYRNKKRTISLSRLQAEIDTACLMTSWRHFVTLFHHANTTTITTLSSATKEITETKWNQLSSTFADWDEGSSFLDVM